MTVFFLGVQEMGEKNDGGGDEDEDGDRTESHQSFDHTLSCFTVLLLFFTT